MPSYGYDQGNPFGDPNRFTRSTQEDEIDRFNDWMRSQPWWQAIRGSGTGDLSDQQQAQIVQAAQAHGITVPSAFHIDEGGNFNQRSRTRRNLIIAAAIGGGALTAGLATGVIGSGLGVGGGAGGGGAGAAGGTLAGVEGAAFGLPAASAAMVPGAVGAALPAAGASAGGGGLLGFLGRHGQDIADIGGVATGAAGGAAAGRRDDDRTALAAANLNMNAPTVRAQQVARGDLMAADIPQSQRIGNGRDVSFTGGVGPQLFGPATAQAGEALRRQALTRLMSGEPEFTPTPSGVGERITGGIGMTGSILGALGRRRGR